MSDDPKVTGGSVVPSDPNEAFPKRFGKYTLLRKLAVGGMAELFLALHKSVAGFEKLIVIKRILPSVSNDQAFIEMLLREARIAAKLSHPNIVQIYDVGFAEGRYYIAMEHIHGEDIRSIIRQMKRAGLHEFPLEHALVIAQGTCAGLAYAHEQRGLDGQPLNIVHRDISPQNILVTYTGDIKIVDFGIAKAGTQVSEDTRSGKLKGKVPYMSPEQALGEELDGRSDIFSTGILLFELTTGKRLFKAKSELETMRLICDREYPRPSQVKPGYPPKLERIVMKALEKDRNRRYQLAREMQADLDEYIRSERLEASTLKLRSWMESLFAEKLERQKGALQDLKKLADVIASDSLLDSNTSSGSSLSTGGASSATISTGGRDRPQSKHSHVGVIVALVMGMLAAGVGGYWVLVKGRSSGHVHASSSMSAKSKRGEHAKYGTVHVETLPSGAAVWVAGQLYPGKTPVDVIDLPRGTPITIKVTREGLVPRRKTFTLDDEHPKQTWKVDMRPGTFALEFECNVPGVRILLDGHVVKNVDEFSKLAADKKHKLIVSAKGYQAQVFNVEGSRDETKKLKVMLKKAPKGEKKKASAAEAVSAKESKPTGNGRLNVGSRGGYCNVSIGGRGYGPTPVGGIVLPAGPHVVVCKPNGGPAKTMSVSIKPGQTSRVSFHLGGG